MACPCLRQVGKDYGLNDTPHEELCLDLLRLLQEDLCHISSYVCVATLHGLNDMPHEDFMASGKTMD